MPGPDLGIHDEFPQVLALRKAVASWAVSWIAGVKPGNDGRGYERTIEDYRIAASVSASSAALASSAGTSDTNSSASGAVTSAQAIAL